MGWPLTAQDNLETLKKQFAGLGPVIRALLSPETSEDDLLFYLSSSKRIALVVGHEENIEAFADMLFAVIEEVAPGIYDRSLISEFCRTAVLDHVDKNVFSESLASLNMGLTARVLQHFAFTPEAPVGIYWMFVMKYNPAAFMLFHEPPLAKPLATAIRDLFINGPGVYTAIFPQEWSSRRVELGTIQFTQEQAVIFIRKVFDKSSIDKTGRDWTVLLTSDDPKAQRAAVAKFFPRQRSFKMNSFSDRTHFVVRLMVQGKEFKLSWLMNVLAFVLNRPSDAGLPSEFFADCMTAALLLEEITPEIQAPRWMLPATGFELSDFPKFPPPSQEPPQRPARSKKGVSR